ncbi:MAG: amidohydrolase family protein [Nitritalea sp.]
MRKFLLTAAGLIYSWVVFAQGHVSTRFEQIQVFDSRKAQLLPPMDVRVRENKIVEMAPRLAAESGERVIDGSGKTLLPGLIDVHVHLTFGALSMKEMLSPMLSQGVILEKVGGGAEAMLLRGFTSVRDAGGPIFPLKAQIDAGSLVGPRIWPSGATISQTAGHGDFRSPDERSRKFFGEVSRAERMQATFIADGRPEVLTAVRENLRFGASQIKLMAGGGTSSAYDPVDVTQYTFDEMQAAVEAAEDWGTYVMVHAYTPRAVQKAIRAGVKCIEHGQILDKKTLRMMKRNGVWLSTQNLVESTPEMDPLRVEKRKPVLEGQEKLWPMAKKMNLKIAWGTDFLFEPELNKHQNAYILRLQRWFTNAEVLQLVTYNNGQLLQLSGMRSPYPGSLGVIEEGAFADLIVVEGNPVEDLSLIASPETRFLVIMKDGQIVKDIMK